MTVEANIVSRTSPAVRWIVLSITALFGASLAAGLIGAPAQAGELESEYTNEEVDLLAEYLEFLHEPGVIGENGELNRDAIVDRYGQQVADDMEAGIASAEDLGREAEEPIDSEQPVLRGWKAYGLCLLGGVIGGPVDKLVKVWKSVETDAKKKKWKSVASKIAKEASKRGLKVLVKGGVAGLAATLAIYGVKCTPTIFA
ncbi:hypothetical protein [Salininema proteolyticum]|uniref:Secreted protein n=1 Tax=Salininema proteolyticum TaxID=1607685 RepID=A0ABV8U2H5_9ACTN